MQRTHGLPAGLTRGSGGQGRWRGEKYAATLTRRALRRYVLHDQVFIYPGEDIVLSVMRAMSDASNRCRQ